MSTALYWVPNDEPWILDASQNQAAPRVETGAPEGFGGMVLVPTEHVLLTEAQVPARSQGQMLQALPFALEEFLAAPVEEMHCVAGPKSPDGAVAVAVIQRDRLQAWLDQARDEGWEPRTLIPDVLALPWEPDTWSILPLPGARLLIRDGATRGWATTVDDTLDAWWETVPSPSKIVVLRGPEALPAELTRALRGLGVPVEEKIHEAGWGGWLSQGITGKPALQLLQGAFQRQNPWAEWWRPWRLTLTMLGLLLAIQIAVLVEKDWRERRESQAIQTKMVELYRQTFPDAKNIVDPRLQMERKLQALQNTHPQTSEAHFARLLSLLAQAVKNRPGLILHRLEYRNQALQLHLSLDQFPQLESFKQALQQAGGKVELLSAETRSNRVETHMRLEWPVSNP